MSEPGRGRCDRGLEAPARLRAACLHFGFLLLAALGLAVATPPFQVPDEHQHFFRAFQLAEGTLGAETLDGHAGGVLPATLGELADTYLGSRAEHLPVRGIGAFPARATWMRLGAPLDAARREFLPFDGAAPYAPLAYAPQIIGVEIGRAFGAGALALLFLARAANAVAAALLTATAGLILPRGRLLLIGASLLPMSLALFGSASPDASIIGCCFFFCAIAARATAAGRWTTADVAAGCLSGVVVCTVKPVYAPMLLLGLPAALRPGAARNVLGAHAAILLVVGGATALWLGCVAAPIAPSREGVDPAAQLAQLFAHRMEIPQLLAATVERFWPLWGLQLIGKLGWADVLLPSWMYGLAIIALPVAVVLGGGDGPQPGAVEATWALLLAGICFVLVLISLYLLWTPVGGPMVLGVQGRYFLPLAAMLVVAIPRLRRPAAGLAPVNGLLLGAFAIEAVATAPVILSTYGVL